MASEVILPRVDMDMETGSISHWFVGDGDEVEKGQVIFEIETDKAAMEIEAEMTGIVRGISAATGEQLPVGTVVAWICTPGEDFTPPADAKTDGTKANERTEAAAAEEPDAESQAPASADRERQDADPPAVRRPRATPLARRIASRHKIDLSRIGGSGPRGRILRADVAAALDEGAERCLPAASGHGRATPAHSALRVLREGSGVPLVLVHGFASEAGSWRPLLQHIDLAAPIVAIDLPGHGRTELQGHTDFEGLAAFAEDALQTSGLEAIHLVGHSLGGAISARLAASRLFDLRSLTLIAPAGLGPAINGEFLEGLLSSEGEAATAAWLKLLVHDPDMLTPGFVRATMKAMTLQRDAQSRLREALFESGTQLFDIRADLARITAPVRVLVGNEDRIIPAHQTASLPAAVALHRLAGIGHIPQIETPELTGRLIGQTALSAGREDHFGRA